MEVYKTNSVEVLDRAGMSASLVCAVHCAVVPMALMALPALGLAWLDSSWIDWTMVGLSALIALRAHRAGIALHSRCLPVGVAIAGIVFILLAVCALKDSPSAHYVQASGATLVAGSHWLNRRLCRSCTTCSELKSSRFGSH
jgi:hypothetical protein